MSTFFSSVTPVQSNSANTIFRGLLAGIKTAGLASLSVLALQGSNTLYAASYFVDLGSTPSVNGSSLTFMGSDGTDLDVFDSMIMGASPNIIQANSQGVCSYSYFSTSSPFGSRCGYQKGTNDIENKGFSLSFNQDVTLKSFDIGQYNIETTDPSEVTFDFTHSGGSQTIAFDTDGTQSFDPFFLPANSTVMLSSSAVPGATDGTVRISRFSYDQGNTTVPAPGPLPLFGAVTAYTWSRRLREKIKSTSLS
jgi:hypothetical protein